MKDKTPFEEQTASFSLQESCATNNCIEDYVGETAMHIVETVKDHNCREHFHLVKHTFESSHLPVVKKNFTTLDNGYLVNAGKKKITEELVIKFSNSSLNLREKSVELNLLN